MDQHPQVARAIEICGSQPALAEKLRCRQQTVSKMLNREIPVSAEYALLIADATGIPAQDIRPDLPWPSPATQPIDEPAAEREVVQ
jgi:DNA-binding transcriptional regulator YdaS (Cro superfamily)